MQLTLPDAVVGTTAKVFVGIDEPGAVSNLRAYEDAETEGLIHVVWDQPEGVHGGYIDPNDLTYYISKRHPSKRHQPWQQDIVR